MPVRRQRFVVPMLATALACNAARAAVELGCASPEAQLSLREDVVLLRVSEPSGTGNLLLEIKESGVAVELESTAEMRALPVPPRLGVSLLRAVDGLEVRVRLREGWSTGNVAARLECDSARVAQSWAWLDGASTLAKTLTRGVGSLEYSSIERLLDSLAASSYDARSRAWAQHLRAQALLMSGQARDAADAFLMAERAWRAAGEPARASAALVAAAEDMNRAGKFAEVLQLSDQAASASLAMAGYYEVRLRNAGCLALRYLGRLDEAGACYSATTQRLLELGESVELAVTSLDFGTIELDRGNLSGAIDLFQRSLHLAAGPNLDDEHGRAEFYLADAHARAGRPAESVAHLQRAVRHFERSGSMRWLGSSLLRLGGLLSELGATADASAAVESGLRHFDPAHAPGRVASAQLTLARIALRANRPGDAIEAAGNAQAIYQALSMPIEAAVAQDLRLRGLVGLRDWPAAKAATDAMPSPAPGSDAREVTRVEVDLGRGALDEAQRRLGRIDESALALGNRWRVQRARVDLHLARGETHEALDLLRLQRADWLRLARRAGGAVLRERLEQFAAAHAAQAIDVLASRLLMPDAADNSLTAEHALAWLPELAMGRVDSAQAGAIDHAAVDQQLAAALFPGISPQAAAGNSASRALLDALLPSASAPQSAGDAPVAYMPLASLRARLGDDDAVLVALDGQQHVLLVQLSARQTKISVVADRPALLREIKRLAGLVQRADSATLQIRESARRLSEQLSLDEGLSQSSGAVFVLPTGDLTDIAWPVLLDWPEAAGDGRRISQLVPGSGSGESRRTDVAGAVEVYVASQSQDSTLARLEGARREAGYIRTAATSARIEEVASASRQQILAGLDMPDTWVHIAAHGSLAEGRIGGAGLWLDPVAPDGIPDYLSWLEILERGVQAPVVVLNACQLGSRGLEPHGLLGFSSALLRAGAGQVVASFWPTSDSASAVWVQAFYRAAFSLQAPPGEALAQSRAALRRTRAFRHPYYWAGLTHFESIAPAGKLTASP